MQMPESPVRMLSQVEVDAFRTDGVICVRNLYSHEWIERLRAGLDELGGISGGDNDRTAPPEFRASAYNWHTNDVVRDFALGAPTAHLVRQVLGSERLSFFGDQIFVKQALNSDPTPWHHDFTFFPLGGDQMASVWTSVDATRSDESALQFVLGSHLWPSRFRPLGVGGIVKSTRDMEETPDFESDPLKYRIASWHMQPGDAVIFHGLTLHSSRGVPSGKSARRAIATRWCGDDITFKPSETELQVPWKHGLSMGDKLRGPVFPQVLPSFKDDELSMRFQGSRSYPDEELLERNAAMAAHFRRI